MELVLGYPQSAAKYAQQASDAVLCCRQRPENFEGAYQWFESHDDLFEMARGLGGALDVNAVTLFMYEPQIATGDWKFTGLKLSEVLLDPLDWVAYAIKSKVLTVQAWGDVTVKLVNDCDVGTDFAKLLDLCATSLAVSCLAGCGTSLHFFTSVRVASMSRDELNSKLKEMQ